MPNIVASFHVISMNLKQQKENKIPLCETLGALQLDGN